MGVLGEGPLSGGHHVGRERVWRGRGHFQDRINRSSRTKLEALASIPATQAVTRAQPRRQAANEQATPRGHGGWAKRKESEAPCAAPGGLSWAAGSWAAAAQRAAVMLGTAQLIYSKNQPRLWTHPPKPRLTWEPPGTSTPAGGHLLLHGVPGTQPHPGPPALQGPGSHQPQQQPVQPVATLSTVKGFRSHDLPCLPLSTFIPISHPLPESI